MSSVSPSPAAKRRGRPSHGRERILRAAYDLFSRNGLRATGIDAIILSAGIARMTFYRHFNSKNDLVLAFLDEHEQRWTIGWLKKEVLQRHADPKARLLGVFDLFHEWFHQRRFSGCPFIRTLLEAEHASSIHRAAAKHLVNVRSFVEDLAKKAGLGDPGGFAATWHLVMQGSITAAMEGNLDAARDAKRAAAILLAAWGRRGAR
jgi:AcrR family transcriptional regulator